MLQGCCRVGDMVSLGWSPLQVDSWGRSRWDEAGDATLFQRLRGSACTHLPTQSKSQITRTNTEPILKVSPSLLPATSHTTRSLHTILITSSAKIGANLTQEKGSATLPFTPISSPHSKGFLARLIVTLTGDYGLWWNGARQNPWTGVHKGVHGRRQQQPRHWQEEGCCSFACCPCTGRLYPAAVPHPVQWVEKSNPHPSTHTPLCWALQAQGHLPGKAIRKFVFASMRS